MSLIDTYAEKIFRSRNIWLNNQKCNPVLILNLLYSISEKIEINFNESDLEITTTLVDKALDDENPPISIISGILIHMCKFQIKESLLQKFFKVAMNIGTEKAFFSCLYLMYFCSKNQSELLHPFFNQIIGIIPKSNQVFEYLRNCVIKQLG